MPDLVVPKWNADWEDPLRPVDWSHIDFLNMFTDAINERNMIFGVVSSPNYFVVGDDLQVGRSQVGVDTSRSVFGLQGRVSSLAANRWLDCTRALQLETDTDLYGSTQLRLINFNEVLCAMRGTVWDGNRDTPIKFRRKKERTILSVSDTTDTDGNAIADGMRARLVYNSTPLPADQNKVFARTAGAWTLSLDYLPGDTLDSMSAAPDHCAYGGIVPGDYLGIWLFIEMREVLNHMRWLQAHDSAWPLPSYHPVWKWGTGTEDPPTASYQGWGDHDTLENCKAAAIAAFANAGPGSGFIEGLSAVSWRMGEYGGYSANLLSSTGYVHLFSDSPIRRQYDVYVAGSNGSNNNLDEYDSGGTGIPLWEGAYSTPPAPFPFGSVHRSTAGLTDSADVNWLLGTNERIAFPDGDPATITPPAPPGFSMSYTRGYALRWVIVACKYISDDGDTDFVYSHLSE